ncbi:MAG: PAS domain-containing sensor histidine kinase [Terriglobia bacterium]
MIRLRLRTKFLLSLILISAVLTGVALLIVQRRARQQASDVTYAAMHNSLTTFQNFQRHREQGLERSAELLADLPTLRALMTTHDEATIQDGSAAPWRLAGSDLLVLADRTGKLMAVQTSTAGFTRAAARESLERTLKKGESRDWWFGGGHLYEVFLRPIYFGPAANDTMLGVLAVGYEIDDRLAGDIGRIASSHVAFRYGNEVVVSTLSPGQQTALARVAPDLTAPADSQPVIIQLGRERFLAASVAVPPAGTPAVGLTVLESYDQATAFLASLNRLLLGVGIAAVLLGSIFIFFISRTFTRPLEELVSGVRALEKGDFDYPLHPRGGDEAAELTRAFDRMRHSLKRSQEELLHAERLATIGRMASSISHDLRHPLTAILAYAEFLSEGRLDEAQRKDLYDEIRGAVNQMTDLIASLLEFSRARDALQMVYGNVENTLKNAIQIVQAQPDFRRVNVTLKCEGSTEGWFDPKKLQRVLQNLLLNACEAVSPDTGKIEVQTRQTSHGLEIRVLDNGPGIPEPIRDNLFRPFVSYGKTHGTGLGLAVVQKIVQDHGGRVRVESSSEGTSFELTLPLTVPAGSAPSE